MIKTTRAVISGQTLVMVFQKISQSPLDAKVAYKIKKLLDAVQIAMKVAGEEYRKEIGTEFGELDEKGEIIPENNPHGFKLKEGATTEDIMAKLEAFGKVEVAIDRDPLTLNDLASVKISPSEITALDVFLADPAEMEAVHEKVSQLRR